MTLETILSELQYPDEIGRAVIRSIHQEEAPIKAMAESAYEGENFKFPLCRRMPLTRLAVVTYLLLQKYDAYSALGIPDEIIFDTFRDVTLRANRFYETHGQAGLSSEDVIWFRHIMQVGIFKLGTLQFQPFEMLYLDEETIGEPYMTFSKAQKAALPSGTPVLNCHIQQGADISPRSVERSLREAALFFRSYFPTTPYRAFLCYSWLLYPPMLERLPAHSNIRQFAEKFSIIGVCPDPEQALETILGHGKGTRLPHKPTSLQALALAHAELLGFGCGILSR